MQIIGKKKGEDENILKILGVKIIIFFNIFNYY